MEFSYFLHMVYIFCNVKFYTVLTPKMIWEPLNCGSFLDKIYLRLHENMLGISLKTVYEKIITEHESLHKKKRFDWTLRGHDPEKRDVYIL